MLLNTEKVSFLHGFELVAGSTIKTFNAADYCIKAASSSPMTKTMARGQNDMEMKKRRRNQIFLFDPKMIFLRVAFHQNPWFPRCSLEQVRYADPVSQLHASRNSEAHTIMKVGPSTVISGESLK